MRHTYDLFRKRDRVEVELNEGIASTASYRTWHTQTPIWGDGVSFLRIHVHLITSAKNS